MDKTLPTDPKTSPSPAQVSFKAAAISMGWQLAVIVLAPIYGGSKLDHIYNTMPLWTFVGLMVALVGSILIVKRTLQQFGNFDVTPPQQPAATDTHKETQR